MMARPKVHLLDYGAGNVASIRNAIRVVGFDIVDVRSPSDLAAARVLVFPGVGAFGSAMAYLTSHGYAGPLREYISSGRPFLGICIGMQTLFESSEESPEIAGLGVIPGTVARFASSPDYAVPHIGWNGVRTHAASPALAHVSAASKLYFVHSYRASVTPFNAGWVAATTDYGDGPFIAAVQRGAVFASQFHPEKSGAVGLEVVRSFLAFAVALEPGAPLPPPPAMVQAPVPVGHAAPPTKLAKRIIA